MMALILVCSAYGAYGMFCSCLYDMDEFEIVVDVINKHQALSSNMDTLRRIAQAVRWYSTRSKVFVQCQFYIKKHTFQPSTTHFARRQLDLKFRRSIEIQ